MTDSSKTAMSPEEALGRLVVVAVNPALREALRGLGAQVSRLDQVRYAAEEAIEQTEGHQAAFLNAQDLLNQLNEPAW